MRQSIAEYAKEDVAGSERPQTVPRGIGGPKPDRKSITKTKAGRCERRHKTEKNA